MAYRRGRPAAIRAVNKERTVLRKLHAEAARVEPRAEGIACALIVLAHLLQRSAHHDRLSLVTYEELILERPKLIVCRVHREAAGRLPHLRIRIVNRRRQQFWDL